jgi:hypothetical protein
MRNFNNLFKLNKIEPMLEVYEIGYTKVFIYQSIDVDDEIFYSKRINLLFKLIMYGDYILLWFDNIEQMYTELEEYLELEENNFIKIIVILMQ